MKGLINIKNEDDECFRWCHLAMLHPASKDAQRVSKYKAHVNSLDYSGVKFSVSQKDYSKIEKQNNVNMKVFGYEEKQPFPIRKKREQRGSVEPCCW